MDIKLYILLVLVFIALVLFVIFIIKPYLNEKIRIKDDENYNERIALFSRVNTDNINKELNTLIISHLNKYILINITANGEDYIKSDEVNEMIKQTTKKVYEELSDLYRFYISLLVNITDDDDLLSFIYDKVSDRTLEIVTDFNKTT